jgi:protein TonB
MSATKFNLYNAEWLDLVFDQRNKDYGAYELRRHYSRTMGKAMALTFAAITVWAMAGMAFKHKPVDEVIIRDVPLVKLMPPPPVSPKVHQVIPPQSAGTQLPKDISKKINFPLPVIVPEEKAVDPPTVAELQKAVISNKDQAGSETPGGNILNVDIKEGPGTATVTEDEKVRPFGEVEILPQPDGGMAGWAKFLQKNLRYPALARESNISGKVFVSFIVEKDGQLTDIKIVRGLGYGLDEETIRVLKLAKAWKPGIQNGRPVRVAYSIPFAFQLAEEN